MRRRADARQPVNVRKNFLALDFCPAMKRPVRTRMQGVVGRAGEKPALTRLDICSFNIYLEWELAESQQLIVFAKSC